MKRSIILSLVLSTLLFTACGGDEPQNGDTITRVQDGNGMAFLENGKLVNANFNFTQDQLNQALSQWEWERDYCLCYDNSHISAKLQFPFVATLIHKNGEIEFGDFKALQKIRNYKINGKEIIITSKEDWTSSYFAPTETYIILALDLNGESGRMILDQKADYDLNMSGYDIQSQHIRTVWTTIAPATSLSP